MLTRRSVARYDQSQILNADGSLNQAAYEEYGRPYFTSTYQLSTVTHNLSCGAAVTHIILWHYKDIMAGWRSLRFRKRSADEHPIQIDDPHYQKMQVYSAVPQWWYALLLVCTLHEHRTAPQNH